MDTISLYYTVSFGKLDCSDDIDFEYELTEEQAILYKKAVKMRRPLEDADDLYDILEAAYDEIVDLETEQMCELGDEYTLECMGRVPVDVKHLNNLVHGGDQYTLEYLGLTDLHPEELKAWDAAEELDEIPMVCDFDKDFEPSSPYDRGYTLTVRFVDPNEYEDLTEEEARETLCDYFKETPGNYELVLEYLECNGREYGKEELAKLAIDVANEMGISEFEGVLREMIKE